MVSPETVEQVEQVASALGRSLAAQRKPKARACLICGKAFETISSRRYCSDRCRARAWYAAHHRRGEMGGVGEVA